MDKLLVYTVSCKFQSGKASEEWTCRYERERLPWLRTLGFKPNENLLVKIQITKPLRGRDN